MKLLYIPENTFVTTHSIASVEVVGPFTIPFDCMHDPVVEASFRLSIRLLDGRTFEVSGAHARRAYEVLIHSTTEERFLSQREIYRKVQEDFYAKRCPFCGSQYDSKWERCLRCDDLNLFENSSANFQRCFAPNQSLAELLLRLNANEAEHLYKMLEGARRFQEKAEAHSEAAPCSCSASHHSSV